MNLLRRLVEAMERQAVAMAEQAQTAREAEDREQAQREREAREMAIWFDEQRTMLTTVMTNHRLLIAQNEDATKRAIEHIARCDETHRRLLARHGIEPAETTIQ